MDDFEIYIQSNKSHFKEDPLDKQRLWEGIEKALDGKENPVTKVTPLFTPMLKMVALFCLFAGTLFITFLMSRQQVSDNTQAREINEIEAHYSSLINLKLEEIERVDNFNGQAIYAFENDLQDFKTEIKNLDIELEKNINNTIVVEAIIQNYKQHLHLLEQVLNRLERSKIKDNEQSILI